MSKERQERGLCGVRGGEEVRSLQGLINEDEEEEGWKEEEEGDDEEHRLFVLSLLLPSPNLATAPSNRVWSLLLVTPRYSSWRLRYHYSQVAEVSLRHEVS